LAKPETATHYERLAGSYDLNWSHSAAFLDWMAGEMIGALALTGRDRIADVGCGTGLFTGRIREQIRPTTPILCVDPSDAMLAQLPPDPGLRPVQASAEQLARGRVASGEVSLASGCLNVLMIKEAIHHVAESDRRWVIAGLADLLDVGGRFLIVMLPTRIGYPLFPAALEQFEARHPERVLSFPDRFAFVLGVREGSDL
jgi:SAM-dependent methyltransferase